MSLKVHSDQRVIQSSFLFIVLFFTFFNFKAEFPYLIDNARHRHANRVRPIGQEFVGLAPYLKNAPWAGYISCVDSSHPLIDVAVMGPYQQAQFVLSPTLLDYFHPLDHQYVILQCPQGGASRPIEKQLSQYVMLKNLGGVSLFYRKVL